MKFDPFKPEHTSYSTVKARRTSIVSLTISISERASLPTWSSLKHGWNQALHGSIEECQGNVIERNGNSWNYVIAVPTSMNEVAKFSCLRLAPHRRSTSDVTFFFEKISRPWKICHDFYFWLDWKNFVQQKVAIE